MGRWDYSDARAPPIAGLPWTPKFFDRFEQVKGYEIENGQYIILEPDEVAAAVPDSDKTLKIDAFIPCNEIDDIYFDKPYYLAPDKMGTDAFVLLRDGMKKAKVAAIARTVASSASGCGRLVMMVDAAWATSAASRATSTPARAIARRRAGTTS